MADAVADAQAATVLAPRWAKAFARLGSALSEQRKFEDAAAAFEKAAWLAATHDRDSEAAEEYEGRVRAVRAQSYASAGAANTRAAQAGNEMYHLSRDGF